MNATLRVHRYDDQAEGAWNEFITAMRSGEVFECDMPMANYWLGVIPPVWMGKWITVGTDRVLAWFGFCEGFGRVVAFWTDGDRVFGIQTQEINRC